MNGETLINLLMIVFLVIMLARLVLKIKRRKPEQKPLSLVVISQCKSCGNKERISKFKACGDYLLKPHGKCRCGGTIRIIKMYNEEETEKERKWRVYARKFEV